MSFWATNFFQKTFKRSFQALWTRLYSFSSKNKQSFLKNENAVTSTVSNKNELIHYFKASFLIYMDFSIKRKDFKLFTKNCWKKRTFLMKNQHLQSQISRKILIFWKNITEYFLFRIYPLLIFVIKVGTFIATPENVWHSFQG